MQYIFFLFSFYFTILVFIQWARTEFRNQILFPNIVPISFNCLTPLRNKDMYARTVKLWISAFEPLLHRCCKGVTGLRFCSAIILFQFSEEVMIWRCGDTVHLILWSPLWFADPPRTKICKSKFFLYILHTHFFPQCPGRVTVVSRLCVCSP